ATALLAFDPNILASGGLVMMDMAITFAFLFAVFAYYLYFRRRSWGYLALAGVATGVALVAKNSGILVLPVLFLLALSDPLFCSGAEQPRWRNAARNLGRAVLICAIALLVLWTAYGLHFSTAPSAHPHSQDDDYWASHGSSSDMAAVLRDWHILP